MKDKAISKDVALVELEQFVNCYVKKPVPFNELEETYPDVLEAIMEGLLVFDENKTPTYKLKHPIKGEESGNVVLDSLTFRTRIKPSTKADLAKGLFLQTDVLNYQLRVTSYVIDQPIAMLDKLSSFDYDVATQVSTVFQ